MDKETLKKIIPAFVLNAYYRIQYPLHVWPLVRYDAKRFIRFSAKSDTEESLIGLITNNIHSIEKGFTMPDFRMGFGQKRLNEILDQCILYVKKYGTLNVQISEAAKSILDYKKCHEEKGFTLPKEIQSKILTFLRIFPDISTESIQIDMTREDFFSKKDSSFIEFSASRRSSRNFIKKPVDVALLEKSVGLAQNAPSACNRQSPRVYLVKTPEKVQKVLRYQGGNRGFGQTVDKLLIVCGYLGNYHDTERNCVYIDGGIFTMNLAYALHYYGIGCCILNWSVTKIRDKKIREILPIRDNEVVIDILACGNVPESFKLCRSEKKQLKSILTEI